MLYRQTRTTCPFCSKDCRVTSGMVHHLEVGACPKSPLDRDTLYQEVRGRDPHGYICNTLALWQETVAYQTTDLAFNVSKGKYECYFCGDLFGRLSNLNQHLASPRHQQELYHCPNEECSREFTTLAGMVGHLERRGCRFLRLEAVQDGILGFFIWGHYIWF
ncbi:zinc finger OZF [Fusarium circinatum]|uniref:Zinc finger OZF n=1 Tax=Fusarium circinatum TaxID=48490 RepID=A0A8H5SS70_FUSCI|nr:zinc finger OZF [Fusarium circinatum]